MIEIRDKSLQDIQDLNRKLDEPIQFKDHPSYIDEETNKHIAASLNHPNNLSTRENLYQTSNEIIKSRLDSDFGVEKSKLKSNIKNSQLQISELEDKVENLKISNNENDKYVFHASLNSEIERKDLFSAYLSMVYYIVILSGVALAEIFWMKYLFNFSMESIDSEVLSSMGNTKILIGTIPIFVMALGTAFNINNYKLKYFFILEGVWYTFLVCTFMSFGSSTISEAFDNLLYAAFKFEDVETVNIFGLFMCISQSILLSGLGLVFINKAKESYKSTRLSKLSVNPSYAYIAQEIDDTIVKINIFHDILSKSQGKISQIENYENAVKKSNEISLNKWMLCFESLDGDLDFFRDRIQETEFELASLKNSLKATLKAKVECTNTYPLFSNNNVFELENFKGKVNE